MARPRTGRARMMARHGLGQVTAIAPAVASTGTIAFKYLIGSVLAGAGATVVGNMIDGIDTKDSWAERSTFNARMSAMHAGFLMVQCQVGGAKVDEPYGCNESGRDCICPGGTQPMCSLPAGKLAEWRVLRNGFSKFYDEVGGADWFDSDWLVLDPNGSEVTQARAFARSLVRFYVELPRVCPHYTPPFDLADIVGAERGTTSQKVAEAAARKLVDEPAWVKGVRYAAWGLGAVTLLWIGTTLRTAFKKGG